MRNPLAGISDAIKKISSVANTSGSNSKPGTNAGSVYSANATTYNTTTGEVGCPSLLDRDLFGDEGFKLA